MNESGIVIPGPNSSFAIDDLVRHLVDLGTPMMPASPAVGPSFESQGCKTRPGRLEIS